MPELLHTAPIPYVAALGVRTTSDYARMLHMRRNVMQRFTASALPHFRGLYTCAPAMSSLFRSIECVARTDCTVLVRGEALPGEYLSNDHSLQQLERARIVAALNTHQGRKAAAAAALSISSTLWRTLYEHHL